MENLDAIGIEGKQLAVSTHDVAKLTSERGCELNVVTDKVLTLDDTAESDDDEGPFEEEEDIATSSADKLERMKREYLSLVLNSNRDVIKPGPRPRLSMLLESGEDIHEQDGIFSSGHLDSKYSLVHKMYDDLGNYEERLKNPRYDYKEVSPGRVYKRMISVGVGLPVAESVMVFYNCAFWTENSNYPYDSTWLRRTAIVSNLKTDLILPGLHELLLTTRTGEWCEAIMMPEAAFGALGVMPRIPPNARIFCLLEVVKAVSEDKMAILSLDANGNKIDASFADLFEAADEARKRGNYFFEQCQFRPALQRYRSGIRILDAITYKDEIEEKKGNELMLKLYNNTARVANAMGIPRLALSACKQASMYDPSNPKTYWHRIVAWTLKGHLDRALGVTRRALQLFPDGRTSVPFVRKAEELKVKIQSEQMRTLELEKLMSRALIASG